MLLGAALLAAVSYVVWDLIDAALGRSLAGQVVSVGAGIGAGGIVYALAVWGLRVPEARQIAELVAIRLRSRDT